MSPCAEVPTLSATPVAAVLCLGGTFFTLCSHLLPGVTLRGPGSVGLGTPSRSGVVTMRAPEPSVMSGWTCASFVRPARSQQTPNSVLRRVGHSALRQKSSEHSALRSRNLEHSALQQLKMSEHSALRHKSKREHSALPRDRHHSVSQQQQVAFPTDAKVRERHRRKREKELGEERVAQNRKNSMEDHHDDCGENLSSLHDKSTTDFVHPCDFDTDDALSDEDHNNSLRSQYGSRLQSYPVLLPK